MVSPDSKMTKEELSKVAGLVENLVQDGAAFFAAGTQGWHEAAYASVVAGRVGAVWLYAYTDRDRRFARFDSIKFRDDSGVEFLNNGKLVFAIRRMSQVLEEDHALKALSDLNELRADVEKHTTFKSMVEIPLANKEGWIS